MTTYYRKSYEVVGYTHFGELLRIECHSQNANPDINYSPVFLSEIEEVEHCGLCGEVID